MTTRQLTAALLGLGLFAMAVHHTLDPDMWWHLRTGQFIVLEGIPRHDPFSFTMAGTAWIAHEWLSEVVMWGVYRIGGLGGLMVFFALLVTLTFWVVYLTSAGRPFLAAFVALLAASSSAFVFGVRPQIFNLLLTALFLYVVERFRAGDVDRRALWLLPVLSVAWANLHSGFLVGVVLLGTYATGEAAQRWARPHDQRTMSPAAIRQLALVAAASFLAAVLNPNGAELWAYPFHTLGSPSMQSIIREWQSPDFHRSVFWPFAGMMALGVVAWLWSRERPSVTEVLLFLGSAAAGLMSVRHIPLFAIVTAPIIARHLLDSVRWRHLHHVLSGRAPAPAPSRMSAAVNWVVLALGVVGAGAWVTDRIAGNAAAIETAYPVAAVDFLEREGLNRSRGFNSYNWGGYLVWRGVPVFVDGRADVYGDAFLFDYDQTARIGERWADALERFNVDYVIVERSARLPIVLGLSGAWREVYRDDVARILLRNEPPTSRRDQMLVP
jgi:hypothetical protein